MVAVSLKKTFFQAEDGIRDIIAGDWSSDVCSSDLTEYGIWDDGRIYTKEIQKEIGRASCRERV